MKSERSKQSRSCCVPASETDTVQSVTSIQSVLSESDAVHKEDWVVIPDACFRMGSDSAEGFAEDGEGPSRDVVVKSFKIAATAVSNAQFREFVAATGYITEAEQVGASFVFYLQVEQSLRDLIRQVPSGLPWWLSIEGASWQRPEGPGTHIYERLDHPVVQVSWNDAMAYCQWAKCRLPSEAQWELAARGGLVQKTYAWGDDLHANGKMCCQIWQGQFPNAPATGWIPGTVAVDRFAPNGFGLFNTAGNVWEWCQDWFSPDYHLLTASENPSYDHPTGRRSMRGGSFLCHDSYCNRYRVAARSSNTPSSASSNLGFRVAADC